MSAYTLPCVMPATSSLTKRFQFIAEAGRGRIRGRAPFDDYAIVTYLPLMTLKMWNFATTSPLAVNLIGPMSDELSDTFRTSVRTSARLILPSAHAFVTATAYICART